MKFCLLADHINVVNICHIASVFINKVRKMKAAILAVLLIGGSAQATTFIQTMNYAGVPTNNASFEVTGNSVVFNSLAKPDTGEGLCNIELEITSKHQGNAAGYQATKYKSVFNDCKAEFFITDVGTSGVIMSPECSSYCGIGGSANLMNGFYKKQN